jgi:hypothetical protein
MTPQDFIAKWRLVNLTERSACQQHFLDLCDLLAQPKPAAADPEGAWYTFERGVSKTGGGQGWADVWMRGHFGWEYKGKHKDLTAAYRQLLLYREDLENQPLLVVCDLDRFEIHTNFTGTAKRVAELSLWANEDDGTMPMIADTVGNASLSAMVGERIERTDLHSAGVAKRPVARRRHRETTHAFSWGAVSVDRQNPHGWLEDQTSRREHAGKRRVAAKWCAGRHLANRAAKEKRRSATAT